MTASEQKMGCKFTVKPADLRGGLSDLLVTVIVCHSHVTGGRTMLLKIIMKWIVSLSVRGDSFESPALLHMLCAEDKSAIDAHHISTHPTPPPHSCMHWLSRQHLKSITRHH